MKRTCPNCDARSDSLALRCACGYVWPEARDIRSDPERPHCGVCRGEMELMTERCPACGAEGYPALRPRRGKKSLGSPD